MGQDWRDETSLAAIDWLVSTVLLADLTARMERFCAVFEPASDLWLTGASADSDFWILQTPFACRANFTSLLNATEVRLSYHP
ncbi:hypothetical protein [Sphingomonas sp. 22176]|uniref:hypothetical protein n=1 Tax=Sphingomonas sp. 22176 TaxID=3453884 RepID=UPI003F836A52